MTRSEQNALPETGSSRRRFFCGAIASFAPLVAPGIIPSQSRAAPDGMRFDDIDSLIDALARAKVGQAVATQGRYFIDASLRIPPGVALQGSLRSPEIVSGAESLRERASLFEIGPNGHIEMGRGSYLGGFTVLRAGIGLPYRSPRQALDLMSRWAGTPIVTTESGCTIASCLIVGFERVNDGHLGGNGRLNFVDVKFDCLNGIRIRGSLDTDRFYRNHGWPYATAHLMTGAKGFDDPSVNSRPGIGFEFVDRTDGTAVVDCLAYGYRTGFRIDDASIKLLLGWADSSASAGIEITGNCEGMEVHGTTSVASSAGLVVDAEATPKGRPVRVFAGTFNARTIGIHHRSGELIVHGATLERATSVQIEDAVRYTRITDCVMRSGGGIVVPSDAASTHSRIVARHNRYDDTPAYAFEIGGPPILREVIPSAERGQLTSASARLRIRHLEGMMVFVQAIVAIRRNGSAAGGIRIPLPFDAATEASFLGRVVETGEVVAGVVAERSRELILGGRNAYPSGDKRTIVVTGIYERA